MEHRCLHKLKDMAYAELDRITLKSEFSNSTLCDAEKLTRIIKNVEKIEQMEKEEVSKENSK